MIVFTTIGPHRFTGYHAGTMDHTAVKSAEWSVRLSFTSRSPEAGQPSDARPLLAELKRLLPNGTDLDEVCELGPTCEALAVWLLEWFRHRGCVEVEVTMIGEGIGAFAALPPAPPRSTP